MATVIRTRAVVDTIEHFGVSVHKVQMRVSDRKLPRIKPGQFLHLALDEYDPNGGFWPESRVFSVASLDADSLQIVYSVKGKFTSRMARELAPGKGVWLKLPFGSFVVDVDRESRRNIVLVAGGTGISPFIPFLQKCLLEGYSGESLRLYYGVQQLSHLLFSELIERCQVELARFYCTRWIEDAAAAPGGVPGFKTGRLDVEAIATECGVASIYYLSGPPKMITTFKDRLRERGVPAAGIRIDEWE